MPHLPALKTRPRFHEILASLSFMLAIVGALLLLASDVDYDFACMSILILLVVILAWLIVLILNIIAVATRRRRPLWASTIGIVLIAFLTIALIHFQIPLKTAVLLSRSSLNNLASQTLSAPPNTPIPPTRAGLFAASDIHTFPGGMAFRTRLHNPFDWCGLAYIPSGTPPALEGYYFSTPLGNNWFELFIATQPYPKNTQPPPANLTPQPKPL